MSPISSRKSVPPSACSNRPRRSSVAPVKAPFSWPNSSDSSRSAVNAEVLSAMNALAARGLCRCSARATSSLPVPDSPMISTVMLDRDRRPMARNTSCMAGAWPSISGIRRDSAAVVSARCPGEAARRTRSIAWSMSKGFGRYSKAPPWYAATALSRSECAVMTITGRRGRLARISSSSSRPLRPGMRMSVTSTSGSSRRSAASTASDFFEERRRHATLPERPLQHPADRRIVVDDPDVKHVRRGHGDRTAGGW